MLAETKAPSQAGGLDQLLTTNEVARLLRISRVTLWDWRRKGLVPPPIKLGLNRLRWRAQDVRNYLNQPSGLLENPRPGRKTKKA
jgi:predicted DNA-binding transcriptional regulator AlpA